MVDMLLNNLFKLKLPFLRSFIVLLRNVYTHTLRHNNDKPVQKSSFFVKKNYQGACL